MLYSDCQMLVTDYNTKLAGWEESGWKKTDGTYIINWKIWRKIWSRAKDITLQVHWVKGHAKNVYNKDIEIGTEELYVSSTPLTDFEGNLLKLL